jgi:hypothetical protein
MKNKIIGLLVLLAGLLCTAQLSPDSTDQALREIQSRAYQMRMFHQMVSLYTYDTPTGEPTYTDGFFAGYDYAVNADYNTLNRLSGRGDLWLP